MTTVHETLHIRCPYVRARQYLHDALSAAAQEGAAQSLLLAAPLPVGHLKLEKGVQALSAAGTDPMHFDEPWYIGWNPEPGGIYPSFSGVLTVRADEDYDGAVLELTGSYAPPLGAAGKLFDKALGQRVARETMQALLSSIASHMLKTYRREEDAKERA